MSNNKIPYLNRTFDDYKKSLREYVAKYYPQIAADFDDASIGSWLIDLVATVGDNLSYYIDRSLSETNIDTATQAASVYSIARSNGLKVPGPKGSMAEVKFSCVIPVSSNGNTSMPAMEYAPIIKKGTRVTSRTQIFEVMEDIDFSKQFNSAGVSDRDVIPLTDYSRGGESISGYKITKSAIVTAGESKVYRQEIKPGDSVPFMEVLLPDTGVMNVESIIFKKGNDFKSDPTISEFMREEENYEMNCQEITRFFEVESLVDQYRWGDDLDVNGESQSYTYGYINSATQSGYIPVTCVTKGKWNPVTQKFITEFTDKGYLRIIFGSGEKAGQEDSKYENDTPYAQYRISKMVRNNFLGKLPPEDTTMYVLYRVGGGASSNVAAGTINNIAYLNAKIGTTSMENDRNSREKIAAVKNSLTVTNPYPSVSGKDAPTIDEIKAMIKYNNAAQERCVTVKDYENRINMLPPRYGSPFRVSAIEENNKIKIFVLGINQRGKLTAVLPEMLIRNMTDYLAKYRMINDFVVIESGEIVHLAFRIELIVDKNYNAGDVAFNVITAVKDYMDINKHHLGEDIFVGDIEREISSVDGVLNLVNLDVYNKYKTGAVNPLYSKSKIAQKVLEEDGGESGMDLVLLDDTDYILNSNADSMFEILNPEEDIMVKMIQR